jgi:hypothetical protein
VVDSEPLQREGPRAASDSGTLGDYVLPSRRRSSAAAHMRQDLLTGKTLAWDRDTGTTATRCPISHDHLAAVPFGRSPRKGFEFVNSTQGGDKHPALTAPRTEIKARAPARPDLGTGQPPCTACTYDGQQMNHRRGRGRIDGHRAQACTPSCIPTPKGFAAGRTARRTSLRSFDRPPLDRKTQVQAAIRPRTGSARTQALHGGEIGWNGGKLRITRLAPSKRAGRFDLRRHQGQQDRLGRWCPWPEYLV